MSCILSIFLVFSVVHFGQGTSFMDNFFPPMESGGCAIPGINGKITQLSDLGSSELVLAGYTPNAYTGSSNVGCTRMTMLNVGDALVLVAQSNNQTESFIAIYGQEGKYFQSTLNLNVDLSSLDASNAIQSVELPVALYIHTFIGVTVSQCPHSIRQTFWDAIFEVRRMGQPEFLLLTTPGVQLDAAMAVETFGVSIDTAATMVFPNCL